MKQIKEYGKKLKQVEWMSKYFLTEDRKCEMWIFIGFA